jgi:hypothetical protein
MYPEPTHVAEYFARHRRKKGLRLGQIARMLGYGNIGKGARRVQAFERTGEIHSQLFTNLMAVLEIDEATVNRLRQKDLEDWTKWANEPIRPYLVVRLMAAVYSQVDLPDEVRSVEEAEQYASGFAKERRLHVCLVLSRRVSVYFADDGSFRYASEAIPSGEPNQPYTKIGGRRCRTRVLKRGIALPQVEWFKRPMPRGEET